MDKALVEAMYCGLPSVATAVGGVPEIIQDGVHGPLVPARDVSALGQMLLRLLLDPDRRDAMGLQAVQRAQEFSAGRMIETLETLYEELLDEHKVA
jgi:glycosyltransferase involved in cell wall biosynthesis